MHVHLAVETSSLATVTHFAIGVTGNDFISWSRNPKQSHWRAHLPVSSHTVCTWWPCDLVLWP